MEGLSLYDHQTAFLDKLRDSMRRHRRVIACARTGFGKSRIAKWIAGSCAAKGGRVLIAVHRRGLVDNMSQAFSEGPELPHGVIMSNSETARAALPVQVASIDTLLSWYADSHDLEHFQMIIYDETHSHFAKLKKYLAIHGGNPFVLGLSATPEAKGLADVFREIVTGASAEWLEVHGYASPFRYLCGKKGRLGELIKRGNKFTDDSQDKAMQGLQGEFLRDWMKHAYGRPTVGFFPRLAHAQEALEVLQAEGVTAGYVDAETPDDVRRELFRQLDAGQLDYLCNVGIVERGTNIPAISCIQLCVAIGDRKRYIQMLGRGSRMADGKLNTLILDHGGNVQRFGLYTDEVEWTLDQTEKPVNGQPVRPTIECPQCHAIYRGGKCRACGYEPSQAERKSQSLEFDGTELVEWKPRKRAQSTAQRDPQAIVRDMLYRCANSGRTYRQAMGMAKTDAERRGQKMQWPKWIEIKGKQIPLVPYGDPRQHLKVADVFPFMVRS